MPYDPLIAAADSAGLAELNHAILESALDCIITMDAAGVVREFNPAAERTFGYTREQAVGRELASLIIPPALQERHRQGLARYLATGEGPVLGRRIEIPGLRADGSEILVELAITAFHLGTEPVFAAYLRDVTVRVRAERRRDAQYAIASLLARSWSIDEAGPQIIEMIAQSGDWVLGGLWLADPGEKTMRYRCGWQEDLPGLQTFAEISRAMVFSDARSLPGRVVTAAKPTWIIDVKSDPDFPRSAAASAAGLAGAFAFPISAGGELNGVIELFSQRTVQPDEDLLLLVESLGTQIGHFVQRRRIEDELQQQKEAAEAANAAKDKFLAALSHELRTPLTPVLMWAGEMVQDPALSPELREELQMVVRNIELEARLIDDLLDVTRIARGRLRLQLQDADAHQLVRHAIEIVRRSDEGRAIELAVELEADDAGVHVDPARIQQVFWNVLRNAWKFTAPQGRITVRSQNRTPGTVTFEISDSGIGIAPENLQKIFQAFEQVDEGREGLGLGLAISKAVVDLHHGALSAQSAGLGQGTTFLIELPTAAGA